MNRTLSLALLFLIPSQLHASWHFFQIHPDPLKAEQTFFKEGRYEKVISLLGHGHVQYYRDKNLARAYFYLGQSYEYTNHLGKALGIYELGANLFPNNLSLLSALALLLHRAGLEEEAHPLFEKILLARPKNAEAHLALAEIDAHLGSLKRSADHYQKTLAVIPENADIWRHYAELLLRLRDYEKADQAAQKSLSLSPNPKTLMDICLIENAQGQIDLALKNINSSSIRIAYGFKALRLKGLWLLEARRYSDAASVATTVIKENPDDPIAHWIKAQISLKAGKFIKAREELEEVEDQREAPFAAEAAKTLLKSLPQA